MLVLGEQDRQATLGGIDDFERALTQEVLRTELRGSRR